MDSTISASSTPLYWVGDVPWPLFLADNGHRERAMRELGWIARDGLSNVPRDMHWLLCTALLAEACGILADPGWSAIVYRQLKPYENRLVVFGYGVGSWGSVSRSLGILATTMSRWAEAEEHFQTALAQEMTIWSPALGRVDVACVRPNVGDPRANFGP